MLKELLKKPYILLDGAMGTMLQQNGLKHGENPMVFNVEHPDVVENIHRMYRESGSNILLSNTFGASRKKLEDIQYSPDQVIKAAVGAAKNAAEGKAMVALDIGPIGELMAPAGTLKFDDAYKMFSEQVLAGDKAGADMVFVETMTDLNEVRAALLAVKENSSLPVFVTMTFEKNGRTFTGCSAESFAIVATAMGADAIGINCSLGPKEISSLMKQIVNYTDLPVIMKPNAGLPNPLTGEYEMSPEDFAQSMSDAGKLGIQILGGCCGTSPDYIVAVKQILSNAAQPEACTNRTKSMICSQSQIVSIDGIRIIGERINPTGKKLFRQALIDGNLDYVMELAISQEDAGAHVLDINVGVPELDEPKTMAQVVNVVQSVTRLPLQIDSSDPLALESGLRYFAGKAIVNSVNGEQAVLDKVLPIVKKYGASVVGLTLDEKGIPENAEDRVSIARHILNEAVSHGIKKEDVFIDCLALTVSAQPEGAKETLKAIRMIHEDLGLHTVLGVSNISFGLPNRDLINSSFLTLAMEAGLDMPIINPNSDIMMDAVYAFNLINLDDKDSARYIARFSESEKDDNFKSSGDNGASNDKSLGVALDHAIAKGLSEEARNITTDYIHKEEAMTIVNDHLIPALDRVGQRFESGEIFLPQLLNSAQAAGEAFEVVKEKLARSGQGQPDKGTIIVATVKGDIHDIGKNIVKVILENYGYKIIDLGKDVPPSKVVEVAKQKNVSLIGLSALMTTTLGSMAETINALRDSGHKCKIMVGGAVLTAEYASEIGADYYSKDAKEGVEIARKVFDE